jgi:general L-amino acid transport system permease protein
VSSTGAIPWLRRNLFGSLASSLMTLISIAVILLVVPPIFEWAVLNSVWNARSLDECRTIIAATHGEGASGACWAVINERKWQFLFGFYPSDLYWRPTLAFVLLVVAVAPVLFTTLPRRTLWLSALYPFIAYVLIWGISAQSNDSLIRDLAAAAGMEMSTAEGRDAARVAFSSTRLTHFGAVESPKFGGLLLVIIIAVIGIATAIPIGIALELGRRSSLIVFRSICVAAIEVFRGVPVIVPVFAGSILLYWVLPPGTYFDLILRAALILALVTGTYISEAIRAGFAALPWGQYEAAAAMGLTYRNAMRLIILPQVLRNTTPRMLIACTGLIRDISIVAVIGLLDPIGLLNPIRADVRWNGVVWELFVILALLYGAVSYAISRFAAHLDNRLEPCHRGQSWSGWR